MVDCVGGEGFGPDGWQLGGCSARNLLAWKQLIGPGVALVAGKHPGAASCEDDDDDDEAHRRHCSPLRRQRKDW